MTIKFVCRGSKTSRRDGLTPLELYVIINGKRRYVSLNRRIDPKLFNPKKQIVRGDDQVYKNANSGAETIYFTALSAPKSSSSHHRIISSSFHLVLANSFQLSINMLYGRADKNRLIFCSNYAFLAHNEPIIEEITLLLSRYDCPCRQQQNRPVGDCCQIIFHFQFSIFNSHFAKKCSLFCHFLAEKCYFCSEKCNNFR